MGLTIDVQYGLDEAGLPAAAAFQAWASAVVHDDPCREVTVRIVDEAESAALNYRFRGKDAPTNVLSFPFEAPPVVASAVLGDVVICAPVVAREAREQGKPERAHWAHLCIHGLLHLLGYDHQAASDAARMEGHEIELLATLGFSDPYARSA